MGMDVLGQHFSQIDVSTAVQVVALGFVGGVLSGFIGSGGAFFMTPGMMNLGVMGPVAVGSNIAHKFGKAIIGSKKHGELGHVDRKLAAFMLLTAAVGIRLAVMAMKALFKGHGSEGADSSASDLYISIVFVSILSVVSLSMLRDILRARKSEESQPSRKIVDFLGRLRLRPLIYFPVADVHVSLWVVLVCGLATGYLAGTIGVGGFVGVPAMIYVFGVPSAVAAGSELYLAMFMGAFGLLNYGYEGMVDVRLVLLLYLGSLVGIYIGAYGTKVVKELVIRLATSLIILLCVVSRAIAIPVYLRKLQVVSYDPAWDGWLQAGSKGMLYFSGLSTTILILVFVFRGYIQRRRVHASIVSTAPPVMMDGRLARKES
jgi:uncharacterized membrane protein YfcA